MTTTGANVHTLHIADAGTRVRHVFIRDLLLTCLIGVHKHEQKKPQRVRINLDLAVLEDAEDIGDRLSEVVCYEDVADGIRNLLAKGHVNLVETLAEQIAEMCLADARVRTARVRVEKLDVFPDATSAGVEIERFSPR
ncbi:MAG: dihydroneopterin aldolase [Rhodospirillaceae bacterium]